MPVTIDNQDNGFGAAFPRVEIVRTFAFGGEKARGLGMASAAL